MRILSLSRPWPWSIFDAPAGLRKTVENRSWPCPSAIVGERIALHAAKSWDDNAFPFLIRLGLNPPARFDLHPHGVIVGVATIERVVTTSLELDPDQRRWFFETRGDGKKNYGWVLADVRKMDTPYPYRGAQGLRDLSSDTVSVIERSIAA